VDRRQSIGVRADRTLLGMIVSTEADVIDVWMQHPTLRHSQHEMFDSLRRWPGAEMPTAALPLDTTIRAMDEGGVAVGLTAAWYGPAGDLIATARSPTMSGSGPSHSEQPSGCSLA
jgi:hypothetical protein